MKMTVHHEFRNGRDGHVKSHDCMCSPRKEVLEGEEGNIVAYIHGKLPEI